MPRLFVEEEGTRRVIDVGDDAVIVGRAADNKIVIRDRKSSRKHCRVLRQGKFYVLEDMNSSNGTLLNGEAAGNDPLRHGDKIVIGEVEITFVDDGKGGPWEDNGAAVQEAPEATQAKSPPTSPAPATKARPKPVAAPSDSILEEDDEGMLVDEEPAAAPAATANPRLVIVSGPGAGDEVEVSKTPFFIGRKSTNNMPLGDTRVSGMHCRLLQEAGRWFVEDLDSGNGVVIADRRQKKQMLHNGDVMVLGSTEIRIEGLPSTVVPGGASPDAVMQTVDHFGVSEDDISRIEIQQVPASPLQPVWTVLFGVLFVGALYFTYDLVQSEVNKDRVVVDPENLVLVNSSFEEVDLASGATPGWGIDPRGDGATVSSDDQDAFHGKRALEFRSKGGKSDDSLGFVRLVERDNRAVNPGERYELTAHIQSSGFESVGVQLLWESNIDRKLVGESAEMGTARPGRYTYFRLITEVPDHIGARHCQVAITGHGRGTIKVDNVVLKRMPNSVSDETEPIQVTSSDATSPIKVSVDSRGVFCVERGKKPRFRSARFCVPSGTEFPFGQLFSLSSNPPEWRENGIVSSIFQFQSSGELVQVEQQFQQIGEQVKVTWRLLKPLPEPLRAAVLLEVDGSVERGPVALYSGGAMVATDGFTSLDSAQADEMSFGRHEQQVVLTCSTSVTLELVDAKRSRDVTSLLLTLPAGTDVFELFIGEVSGRERRRLQELLDVARASVNERVYWSALEALTAIEREFPSDRTAMETVRERRTAIEAIGEAQLAELEAMKRDLRSLPMSPIHAVLVRSAGDVRTSFQGTSYADRAEQLLADVNEDRERSGLAVAGANEARLMELGRVHMGQRNNNIARFYFEWVVALDGPERANAEQQIRLLDERR